MEHCICTVAPSSIDTVSAAICMELLTTLFNLCDVYTNGDDFPFLPQRNVTKPPWDAQLLRFACDASE